VANDESDEDNDIFQEFVWEDMNNYKGQREHFMGCAGPQDAAKHVTVIVVIFQLFLNRELINRYTEQFLHRHKLSSRSTAREWK
jgi:hypothetical protein